MDEYIKRVFGQVATFIKGLSPVRKAAMAATGAIVLVGMVALFFWAGNKSFKNLMTNLSPEDSSSIIGVLREKHIPFRVDPTGKNISVPPENLDQLRLELATMGYPQSSTVGYEVFDKQTLGTTSFVQKINQKRALEGELMRTIGAIQGVRRSRVHLAIPQKSTFVEDQRKATASVVVDLEPGFRLGEKQIFGIGNLVARAVEGMDVSDVVIVDANGKVLSKNPSDPLAAATATQFDFSQKLEQDLERRVEEMLAKVVGEGRVVARVTADLDFSQVNETQTLYDADGSAVLSVEKNNRQAEGSRPGPQGPAGATANTPGQAPQPNPLVRNNTQDNREITNYQVPQTVRRTIKPSWTVKKLSVAVVVDGKQVKSTDKDGNVLAKVEPWAPEKLTEFEAIISGALGIDKKRGDTLEIKNMEFTHEDFDEANRLVAETERKHYIQTLIIYGVIGLTIALFFFLVVRPYIKWVTDNTIESVDSFLPQTIEELEKIQKNQALPGLEEVIPVMPDKVDPEKVEGEMIKEKIITLVDSNPHKAALILKDWLHRDSSGAGAGSKDAPKGGGKEKTA